MVRWMCGVSLKERRHSVDLYSLGVADVVRRGRFRWFRHLERKGVDDGCRPVEIWWWQG